MQDIVRGAELEVLCFKSSEIIKLLIFYLSRLCQKNKLMSEE